MIAWLTLAPVWCAELRVLGPKCSSPDCLAPARFLTHWPGQDDVKCERCTAYAVKVAEVLGFELQTKRLEYAVGRDDAEQQFAMMELT